MTNTHRPVPTPPRHRDPESFAAAAAAGLSLPPLPMEPDRVPDTLGHIAGALTLMAHADQHAAAAIECRALEDHQRAGQFRERERMALKRADLLVAIAHAEALDHIAADLNRLALGR